MRGTVAKIIGDMSPRPSARKHFTHKITGVLVADYLRRSYQDAKKEYKLGY